MNENQHPLTEITDEMVEAAARATHSATAWPYTPEIIKDCWRRYARAALTAALTVALPAEDARPWEPLNGGPVRVGDEVRQDHNGVTTTGVVGRVDMNGDPWTAEGRFIGVLEYGTWHVRRAAPELPPERDGVVLVPADGHETITTADGREFSRLTFTNEQDMWYGPALSARLGDSVIQTTSTSWLTPDTWKVEGK